MVMKKVTLGTTTVLECSKCEGLWVDTASLARICSEREQQSAVAAMVQPPHQTAGAAIERVRYLPCPVCRELMNRVNFAGYSNVIVDVCKSHGTWFDCDELRRVVEFIQSGGLDQARRREMAQLETQRNRLKAMQMPGAWETGPTEAKLPCARHQGVSLIADALTSFICRGLDGF